jgi:uncharacterized protein
MNNTRSVKPSLYNYSARLSDGEGLFLNFYTLKLLVLNSAEFKRAGDILKHPSKAAPSSRHDHLSKLLRANGFLIEEDIDEKALLESAYENAQRDERNLGLTILPTLDCNFRCAYCYEERSGQVMSSGVEAGLVRFVEKNMPRDGHVSVNWYGGEPLMRMDAIERLTKPISDICRKRNSSYEALAVTNGYLLTPARARRLLELGIGDVHITLDGPPTVHDSRRPLQSGAKTFRRILDNIKAAPDPLRISIRINVDQRNKATLPDLLDLLSDEGLNKRVGIYLGQTYPYTAACKDIAGMCLSDEDFSWLNIETAVEKGFYTLAPLRSRDIYCGALIKNNYVVNPSGLVHRCWSTVCDPSEATGNLLRRALKRNKDNEAKWACYSPFSLECADCLFLPICMGGCPFLRWKQGKVHCLGWKHHPKESLMFYYLLKKAEREAAVGKEFRAYVDALKDWSRSRKNSETPIEK